TAMESDIGSAESSTRRVRTYQGEDDDRYVYGSAEVVGLMCLKVFLREEQPEAEQLVQLEHGARQLGAAFQNVNFLRDLADDTARLNRSYLTGRERLSENLKQDGLHLVNKQLDDARCSVALLPK